MAAPAAGCLEDRSGRISAFNRGVANEAMGSPIEGGAISQAPSAAAHNFLPEHPFYPGQDPQAGVIARSVSMPQLPRRPILAVRYEQFCNQPVVSPQDFTSPDGS